MLVVSMTLSSIFVLTTKDIQVRLYQQNLGWTDGEQKREKKKKKKLRQAKQTKPDSWTGIDTLLCSTIYIVCACISLYLSKKRENI